jgi:NAD(P)-dependent dehydrogenase (short-subunit alcohol dehydrogenase family)
MRTWQRLRGGFLTHVLDTVGDSVSVALEPIALWPEPKVPADLAEAFASDACCFNRSQCTDPSMSRNGVPLEPTPAIGKAERRQASGRSGPTLDVTHPQDAQAAVETAVAKFGRIDILVNNAGNFFAGFFEELRPEQVRNQIETLLFGPMNVTRAVLPVMRKQRSGLLITISSTAGIAAKCSARPMRPPDDRCCPSSCSKSDDAAHPTC